MAAQTSPDNELYGVPCSFKNRAIWFRFPPILPSCAVSEPTAESNFSLISEAVMIGLITASSIARRINSDWLISLGEVCIFICGHASLGDNAALGRIVFLWHIKAPFHFTTDIFSANDRV